jgi:hypothetical protein
LPGVETDREVAEQKETLRRAQYFSKAMAEPLAQELHDFCVEYRGAKLWIL